MEIEKFAASQQRVKQAPTTEQARGARANKRMRSLIIGIGVLPPVGFVLGTVTGLIPWHILSLRSWSATLPPQALHLPWISGWFGWGLVLLCVGCTAWTIWFERHQPRRVEPLALLAVCLAVLGHAEGIYGGMVTANTGCWPLNLLDVSIWILCASAGVGLLAWVRLLLTKDPTRGRLFATCVILCSLSSAWIVHTFLVDCWESPFDEDGIELPVIGVSGTLSTTGEDTWPELKIFADGQLADVSLEDVARAMPHKDGLPDGVLRIRADQRASWSVVQQTIEAAKSEGIWKISFAARWEQPPALRRTGGFFTSENFVPDPDITLHTLRVTSDGAFLPGDLGRVDRTSLQEWWSELQESWTEDNILQIAPSDDARWGSVIEAISLLTTVSTSEALQPMLLGPFPTHWY